MISDGSNYYVITSGPGSGKTSIIEALRARGFRCVDEVGRAITQEQLKIGGSAMHRADRVTFRELMLSRSIRDYEQVGISSTPVFFDRGIPGLIGYCRLIDVPAPLHLWKAAELFRYNARVFVTPPWGEIYRNDAERKQDFAEAVATYEVVTASYREAGYALVEIPKLPVEERVDFILAQTGFRSMSR